MLQLFNVFPIVFLSDAILNMVNNIAANVLGGKPELEDGAEMEGVDLISASHLLKPPRNESVLRNYPTHLLLFAWQLFVTSKCCRLANSAGAVRPASESTSLMVSVAALASIKLSQGVCVCVFVRPERTASKCCSNTHVAFLNAEVKFKNTLLL